MYASASAFDLAEVVEVVGEVLGALAHRLDRRDREPVATALLAEVPEVLLAVRRDLAQHRDAPVPLPLQPRDDERGVATDVAVAEPEAVLALQPLGAGPADERHLQLVRERRDRDRVVGAVRAGDRDAALVDQVPEPVGRVLRGAVRQTVLAVQHELVRPVQEPALDALVEGQAVDLVVTAVRPVERRAEPADLDGFGHVVRPPWSWVGLDGPADSSERA